MSETITNPHKGRSTRQWVNGWLVEEWQTAVDASELVPLRRQREIQVWRLESSDWSEIPCPWFVELSTRDAGLPGPDIRDRDAYELFVDAVACAGEWAVWLSCPGHEYGPSSGTCLGCGYDGR